MFDSYQKIARQYKKPSLEYERNLILLAKKVKSSAKEELLYYQIGFFLFRIKTTLYPSILRRYGEDILQDCLKLAIKKISTYNLMYRNKLGELHPVYFRTYMWKSVSGLLINLIKKKKEVCFSDLSESYYNTFFERRI